MGFVQVENSVFQANYLGEGGGNLYTSGLFKTSMKHNP